MLSETRLVNLLLVAMTGNSFCFLRHLVHGLDWDMTSSEDKTKNVSVKQ
jgi:hypothetical protein